MSNSGATSCHNHWDDHDIRVVFDQHASLYFHSARSLKQQSTSRYVYSSRTHYTDCKPISLCKNKLNSWMYFTESWFVLDQYDLTWIRQTTARGYAFRFTLMDTLPRFRNSQSLLFSPYCCVLIGISNRYQFHSLWFDRTDLEPAIYHTWG